MTRLQEAIPIFSAAVALFPEPDKLLIVTGTAFWIMKTRFPMTPASGQTAMAMVLATTATSSRMIRRKRPIPTATASAIMQTRFPVIQMRPLILTATASAITPILMMMVMVFPMLATTFR